MTRSRRAVLGACGAGLTALAGCSRLEIGGDSPTYDATRLVALGRKDLPRPPTTFPVSVPDAMVSRHRDRARTLVERVPEQPAVPNGAVVERLRHDREAVLERLSGDGDGDDSNGPAGDPLERLGRARYTRREAAAVEAAYRAATNAITPGEVADRRAQLRSDLLTFERDWTYRGDDPASAVRVHRALEELRRDVRRGIDPERAFPDDPGTGVFRVGEIVSRIEAGRAALTDAERLRTRYRRTPSGQRPFRTAISVAAGRVRWEERLSRRNLHRYVDADAGALPFDRSIEDTPLERLYREAAASVRRYRNDVEGARHRGEQATALMVAGKSLAAIRALDAIVGDIRNDRIDVPRSVDGIAAARREAVDTLGSAWSASPAVVGVELARPAYYLLQLGKRTLAGDAFHDHEKPDTSNAHRAFVNFVRAARYAEGIPPTVADVQEALRTATESTS